MRHYLLIICAFISINAFGWGKTGHRVVGQIAENHLPKKIRKHIAEILNGESIAMVSNFMDEIKSEHKYDSLAPWHYCTIPDGETYAGAPKQGDVIEAINTYIDLLKSHQLHGKEEAFALKCLIHLVGDIHQPLHVGNGKDKGGNQVRVTYFWKSSNLHRVWDSGMIDGRQLSYTEYANWIDHLSKNEALHLQQSKVLDWAQESKDLRGEVYDLPDKKKINYRYDYDHIATVNQQLLKAGIRLAMVLEEIYG